MNIERAKTIDYAGRRATKLIQAVLKPPGTLGTEDKTVAGPVANASDEIERADERGLELAI